MANRDKYFPSKYLKPTDVEEDIDVTVNEVGEDSFKDDNGTDRLKPILFFAERVKPLILNKTNFDKIADVAGQDTDNWHGTRLVLFADKVPMRGKMVDTIRVRPAPKSKATKPAAEPVEADTEIPF